ncbi:hypothetical protein C4565_08300 [Candidatus Parcubacteria bacterium]|nr:MAG: hypothetical protein C4565_08300 [Candidatus Parcubacteria bacterium]
MNLTPFLTGGVTIWIVWTTSVWLGLATLLTRNATSVSVREAVAGPWTKFTCVLQLVNTELVVVTDIRLTTGIMNVFWKIVATLLALVVFIGSYIAIGFFKCLSFWPRWLPFPRFPLLPKKPDDREFCKVCQKAHLAAHLRES